MIRCVIFFVSLQYYYYQFPLGYPQSRVLTVWCLRTHLCSAIFVNKQYNTAFSGIELWGTAVILISTVQTGFQKATPIFENQSKLLTVVLAS